MKVPFRVRDLNFELESYTSLQERDLLFLTMDDFSDKNILDLALDICRVPKKIVSKLTDPEKKCVLYKLRELSVGNEINIKFKCQKCGQRTENFINISNIINYPNLKHKNIIDNGKYDGHEIFDCMKGDFEEMLISEYESLKENIKNYITTFDFKKECICQRCMFRNIIDISDTKFIIDNLSEETLQSYYKIYNTLIFFGRYSKLDIDSMIPYERTIFLGLLENQLKDHR